MFESAEWVEILCCFKQMLKVSAFSLEKKVLFIKKKILGCSQYQNKKSLFTDPIFSDGFVALPT